MEERNRRVKAVLVSSVLEVDERAGGNRLNARVLGNEELNMAS